MKKLVSILLMVFVVSGCASQSPYAPAGKNGYGYQESQLTENRYRVSFTGNSHTSSELVKDYALLRAAELTLQQGREWFKVVNRETDKQSRQSSGAGLSASRPYSVSRDCGLLGCRTTSSSIHTGASISSTRQSNRYASSIEIVMGTGEPDDPDVVYNAREIIQSLRKKADR